MRGSVVKRGKTWSYVIDVGRDEEGKRRQRWKGGHRTRSEAERELRRALHHLDTGGDPFPEEMTTAAFLTRWLEHQKGRLRPHPYKRYSQIVRDHVLPVIGELRIDRVRPAHVQRVLDEVAAKGLAVRSVVETRAVLSSAMRQAAAWGLVVANPVTAVRPPKGERKELAVPSPGELVRLLEVARGSTWEIPLVLAATTGARRSEVLATRWSDLDLDRARLRITRSLQRAVAGDDGSTSLQFMEPKTDRARREVALTAPTVERLRRYRQEQTTRRLALGPGWTDLDLVCDRGDGGPLDPDAFTRGFKRLAARAGLDPRTRLHDCRHGVATTMLAKGVHPAIASAVLGHASPAFTMSVYQHVLDGMTAQAADALQAAFEEAAIPPAAGAR
jgi:integrase